MDYQGPAHVYWVAPPTNGNLYLPADQQVQVGLSCVTIPDLDAERLASQATMQAEPQSKWAGIAAERALAQIRSKYHGVRNLTIKGEPVKDFDDFYRNGPPEMVSWVCRAVMSSEILTAAEVKN